MALWSAINQTDRNLEPIVWLTIKLVILVKNDQYYSSHLNPKKLYKPRKFSSLALRLYGEACWGCWTTILCKELAHCFSGVRRKFSWGGFIQWHRVVICICCALFVTSQFYVIVLFLHQRFSEVRWHNMHVLLYIHSPYFMCHCTEYNLLALQVRLSEENTPNATIHSS